MPLTFFLPFLGVFCILQLPDNLMYRRLLSYDVSSIAEMLYCETMYGIVSWSVISTPCDSFCVYAFRWPAYRFDDVVSAVRQTSNVDFRLQFAVNWSEETLWAVDAHHSFLADLHTDAALQFIHRNLYVAHHKSFTQFSTIAHGHHNTIHFASILFID